jgi:hypothetical protein
MMSKHVSKEDIKNQSIPLQLQVQKDVLVTQYFIFSV